MQPRVPPPPRRRRRLVLLLSLGGALLAAELLARAAPPAVPGVRLDPFQEVVAGRHGVPFESAFVPDEALFWRLRPDVVNGPEGPLPGRVSNAQGLREDHELARPKPAGELRALCVGDSVTFGFGLPLERTLVEVAERALAERFPGRHVECVNAGVPGWTLYQGWRWLVDEGLALEPDVVVLSFGWNEGALWDGLGDLALAERLAAARPPGPLARSALLRLAWRALAPAPAPDGPPRPRLVPEEFRELLERSLAATRAAGIPLVVLVGAVPENCGPDGRRTALQELQLGLPADGRTLLVLDAVPVVCALAQGAPASELFFDGVHPRAPAARAVGRALADVLAPLLARRAGG